PLVAFPGFDEREVRLQCPLHDVHSPIEFARLFVLADNCADSRRSKECGNSCSACANTFGKSSLRHQIEFYFSLQNHLLEQLVFADIGPDMFANLSRRKQQPHAEAVNTNVIADCCEVLYVLANQGSDQIFWNTTQAESAHHDDGAVENIAYRFIRIGNNFIHEARILNEKGSAWFSVEVKTSFSRPVLYVT